MSNTKFSLDINIAKNFPYDKYTKDFIFIVDGEEFPTSRFVADLLSPFILQRHSTEESFNTFIINTDRDKKDHNISFNSILSLFDFKEKLLTSSEIEYFIDIFSSLGNEKLYEEVCPILRGEITISNVFERISHKKTFLNKYKNRSCEKLNENNFLKNELYFISES